ncbi:putative ABC transporter ATP binding protein [Gordonia effusa NBRC 100432]|uniref:ABC-type quaternary amine transporter n=1 Tax=Gordonia effusa NBRC 100432 TaxID=1077974 RepID=H0R1J8_9ACTN|nr:ABC transporter ATP-binding protein [Gordonia effusa]GAB18949.1 putative ABC transporter ATP binding protein [Gordonia effusa NBRC 100432]
MLEISKLVVAYGDTTVLDGLDWAAGDADRLVTVALGPSGCGKSTLLRAIAGLEPVVSGSISFDGVDLANTPPHRRGFGVVFQDGQLFTGRSVESNVAYGLRMRGVSRNEANKRVAEMLDLVKLSGYQKVSVDELSGGQAQRVALARALAPQPRLLLLDEPLAALDRLLREQLVGEISDIIRATGTPTIMVTHDHTEAAVLGDQISVVSGGVVTQTDTPQDLWRYPVDEATATFLGVTAIVSATATGSVLSTALGDFDTGGRVPSATGPLTIGLRPDATAVCDPSNAAVTGLVTRVTSLPSGLRLRVSVADLQIDAEADHELTDVTVGDDVGLRVIPDRVAFIGVRRG